jgi:hypothetical protein
MAFIRHGMLHDEIDYKKLIESQANQPAFEGGKVVKAKKIFQGKKVNNVRTLKKSSYHNSLHRK